MTRPPASSTLFPYTTLFRSRVAPRGCGISRAPARRFLQADSHQQHSFPVIDGLRGFHGKGTGSGDCGLQKWRPISAASIPRPSGKREISLHTLQLLCALRALRVIFPLRFALWQKDVRKQRESFPKEILRGPDRGEGIPHRASYGRATLSTPASPNPPISQPRREIGRASWRARV